MHAELSGNEKNTSSLIATELSKYNPTILYRHVGGYGIIAVYENGHDGPTVLFRADMDALPIKETADTEYRSLTDTASHSCGHDGHSAVLIGLAKHLNENPPVKGKVILLFQPAEETGKGALRMVESEIIKELKPDMVFAFHNIPEYPINSVILKNNTFASASKGMIIKLKGETSHAAEPEKGNNPSQAMADIITFLNKDHQQTHEFRDFILLTIIHARLGEVAFGTSPGNAEVMVTLRTFRNEDMETLQQRIVEFAEKRAEKDGLQIEFEYVEEFPATENHYVPVDLIRNAATKLDLQIIEKDSPFKWSEDFGWFTIKHSGALFGIGSGVNHPVLHDSRYDFPDEIIETAINLFTNLITQVMEFHT